MRGRERIPCIPITSQEEALSTGKARVTPGSCHHSQSPPDVSVHSRENCFPGTASTFKDRLEDRLTPRLYEGKPCGKASWKASWETLKGKPLIP